MSIWTPETGATHTQTSLRGIRGKSQEISIIGENNEKNNGT